jgi:WD40 repeat protein
MPRCLTVPLLLVTLAGCASLPAPRPLLPAWGVGPASMTLPWKGDPPSCPLDGLSRFPTRLDAAGEAPRSSERLPARVPGYDAETYIGPSVISPRGDLVAMVAVQHGRPKLYGVELESGRVRFTVDSAWATSTRLLRFSRDGERLAVGMQDGRVLVVSTRTGRVEAVFSHVRLRPGDLPATPPDQREPYQTVRSVSFSPDGQSLVSSSADGNVVLWDLHTRRPRWVRNTRPGGAGEPSSDGSASFLPDGHIGLDTYGGLHALDPRNGDLVGALPTPGGVIPRPVGDTAAVTLYSLLFLWDTSADGALVALLGRTIGEGPGQTQGEVSDWIQLWSWSECRRLQGTIVVPQSTGGIVASPDHRWVAAPAANVVRVWDTATGRERFRVTVTPGSLAGVGFSPDGRRLYTISQDEQPITAWSLDDGP